MRLFCRSHCPPDGDRVPLGVDSLEKRRKGRDKAEVAILSLTLLAYAITWQKNADNFATALRYSVDIFYEVVLLIVAAVLLGGLVKAVMPKDFVIEHLGEESGASAYLKGIGIAAILPIEGYMRIPLFEAILEHGAGLGPFATICTTRPVVVNFPRGVAFLGLPIAIIQVIGTIVGALFAGLFAGIVGRWFEV